MNRVRIRQFLAVFLVFGLLVPAAGVFAQEKIYKWVDEDGVVHFSEQPPDESVDAEVEVVKTDPAPRYVPPIRTAVKSPPTRQPAVVEASQQPPVQAPPPAREIDITQMSLSDLDRRCEKAREEKIAPLRAAEIANCVEAGTGDQDWCETFWADYGDPVLTVSGHLTPRMFHDLPECTEAHNERIRRASR